MQLLPRDEKFFDLLLEQARTVLNASHVLADGLTAGANQRGYSEMAGKVRQLELSGDKAVRQINHRLHKTFITPVDPEDVHQIASLIEEILDRIETAAYRLDAYGVTRPPDNLPAIAGLLHRCVEATVNALEILKGEGVRKPEGLTRACETINEREAQLEDSVRSAVRELFAKEKDAVELIKHKEIYEEFESAGDRCENLAGVLEAVAVKNS